MVIALEILQMKLVEYWCWIFFQLLVNIGSALFRNKKKKGSTLTVLVVGYIRAMSVNIKTQVE
jgi:uncharacterized RDD family membrane protein YckC